MEEDRYVVGGSVFGGVDIGEWGVFYEPMCGYRE